MTLEILDIKFVVALDGKDMQEILDENGSLAKKIRRAQKVYQIPSTTSGRTKAPADYQESQKCKFCGHNFTIVKNHEPYCSKNPDRIRKHFKNRKLLSAHIKE